MKNYDATEQAYKNGYKKGYEEGFKEGYEGGVDVGKRNAVKHGRWYKAPHHPYRCSCCGEMALLDMYGESHVRSNFCPNCGADMRGEEDG